MRFRNFDNLRVFNLVARHMSFSRAADELCLTKGAISHQIKRLEEELGFTVFMRKPGHLTLTEKGRRLWHTSEASLKSIEKEITLLREDDSTRITIGTPTYFASRWLSSRLMTFINDHPHSSLRIHPMINMFKLQADNIDMAIRWGNGDWNDLQSELLFLSPAFVTAGKEIADQFNQHGLEKMMQKQRLLHDHEDSLVWKEWFELAGLPYQEQHDKLVIPDPNVRVQAVIDGQGIALNDQLINDEILNKTIFKISNVSLNNYGYFLVYPPEALENPALDDFRCWILKEAEPISAGID